MSPAYAVNAYSQKRAPVSGEPPPVHVDPEETSWGCLALHKSTVQNVEELYLQDMCVDKCPHHK